MNNKIAKDNVHDIIELNMAQKGMLFHYLKEPDENIYNVQLSFDIQGVIDKDILTEAFIIVQTKNESLRSVFNWEKSAKPLQVILKKYPVEIPYYDFSAMTTYENVEACSAKDRQERFDLTRLPVRLCLIKTGYNAYVFNITHHHILYDGWSCSIMIKELFHCYNQLIGKNQPILTKKPLFKEVRQSLQKNISSEKSSRYWKEYFNGYELTTIIAGNHVHFKGDNKVHKLCFNMPLKNLETFTAKHKVTPASVIYAAYGLLLKKYSDLPDVIFGTTVSDRNPQVKGSDQIMGNFINTIPLRINAFEGKTLLEIVTGVNSELIIRSEYYDTSYYEIKQLLSLNHTDDLFDSIIVIENYPIDEGIANIGKDFKISLRSDYENPDIPLVIKVFFKEELKIEFIYKLKDINDVSARSLGNYFIKIISEIVTNPGQSVEALSLLSQSEVNKILYEFNDTRVAPDKENTVLSMFEKQVNLKPGKIAQSYNGATLTYNELNRLSDKIALYLAEVPGVKKGDLVGVMLEREEYLVPCIIGILKTGGAYVPVDPAYPAERINAILEDSALKVLITREKFRESAIHLPENILNLDKVLETIESLAPVPLGVEVGGSDLAYVIYTSGSTGKPKGVMIEHASLENYINWAAGKYVQNDEVTFPLFTSISFDLTITSIFLPLVTGNTMVIYEEDENAVLIEKVIRENKSNVIKLTPSHLKIMRDSGHVLLPQVNSIKRLIVGGENFETSLAKSVYDKFNGAIKIYNEYGPTEATVGCMIHEFDAMETAASVPIGKPIHNAQVYILDKQLKPVPAGISGELYISGNGLARGYLQKEELTKQKFIDNPFLQGQKMYKTGDLARRLPNDQIIFEGRIDSQVKIRGYRIELGEIEESIKSYSEEQIQKPVVTEKFESFSDKNITRCKNCVLTSNYPGVTFNDEGICNVCQDYFDKKDFVNSYFRDESELKSFFGAGKPAGDKEFDCLLLFSGGKDSTYTLYKLLEMGLKVLTFTFDNGFISKAAFHNINNTAEKFKIKSIIRTSAEINKVLLESLRNKHNACTGCWNSINSLGIQVAQEYGIDTIVSGLSRGQIIEMRLEGLLEAGVTDEGEINDNLQLFRKSFHSKDNVFFKLLKSDIDVEFLGKINFIDYFRYDNVNTEGVKEYLKSKEWIQPKDTGLCSTNCVVNDVGIYMHWKKRGYHFYEAPLGWDSRLNVIERQKTIEELSDTFNVKKIDAILTKIGYYEPVKIEDAVVTVKLDAEGNKYIAAYYVSNGTIDKEKLRDYIKSLLPGYMIPNYFVQLNELPLTPNGKTDRKALPDPGVRHAAEYVAPTSKKEKILVEIWTTVLGKGNIGITDNFFSLGGDSIKSIQVSSKMRSAGYDLSVKDILELQTIKRITGKVKDIVTIADQSPVTGEVITTPIQNWFFKEASTGKHHYNQTVMISFANGITEEEVRVIFKKLQEHHDSLRLVFSEQGENVVQQYKGPELPVSVEVYELKEEQEPAATITFLANKIQSSIDLANGPLLKLGLFHVQDGSRLLIVIHHLVVDGISWRILFEDIETLYEQLKKQEPLILPLKTDSYQLWSKQLLQYAGSKTFQKAQAYWEAIRQKEVVGIRRDHEEGINTISDSVVENFLLNREMTDKLLTQVHAAFKTQINDILLTALLLSITRQYGIDAIRIDLEGHGREEIGQGINISRTVGWFTSIYPVVLEKKGENLPAIIKQVKETLRKVPNNGIDYLLQKYGATGNQVKSGKEEKRAQVSFNYLGQFDTDTKNKSFIVVDDPKGEEVSGKISRIYDWSIIGQVAGEQLEISFTYSQQQYNSNTIESFLTVYKENLVEVIDYCCGHGKTELTPSDLTYKEFSIDQLNTLQRTYAIDNIYPLSPMQEGIMFHSLLEPGSGNYFEQKTINIKGSLDTASIEKSLGELVSRYDILRTVFLHKGFERPVQVVLKERKIEFAYKDVREECLRSSAGEVKSYYQQKDRARTFELSTDVLLRVTLLKMRDDEYEFIWSHHHIIMDGWCTTIVWNDFKSLYAKNYFGDRVVLPTVKEYSNYITWLEKREKEETIKYWSNYLNAYGTLATLPKKETVNKNPVKKILSQQVVINKEQTKSLHNLSREYGVTINTILQTAWGILLGKYNHTNDVVFGSVVAGRPAEVEGIETMVGLFINTIPVRTRYNDEDTIAELLQQAQGNALESGQHQYHPLPEIQSLSELGRELLDHILVFENYPVEQEMKTAGPVNHKGKGFIVTNVEVFEQTNYDVAVVIIPGEEITVRIDYNTNSYETGTIEQVLGHLTTIVDRIIINTKNRMTEIEMVPGEEKQQILQQLNNAGVSYPVNKTLHRLFGEQVKRTPSAIAVQFEGKAITYKELNERSNRLAMLLRRRGVVPDTIVGLLMERSMETVVGMLGILKAGGAYLPVDVDYPQERKEYLIRDSGTKIVLTTKDIADEFGNDICRINIEEAEQVSDEVEEIENVNKPSDLCYIIYTSGTTGNPKGVMVEHRNVVRLFFNDRFQFEFGPADVWTMFHSPCFDFSVWEMYGALLFGGRLVVIPKMTARDTKSYLDLLKKEKVTVLNQTPGAFYNLVHEEVNFSQRELSLRYVIFGGEALSPRKLMPWRKLYPAVKLINMFGITETTVHVTYKEIGEYEIENNISNIGKPIPTLSVYILDKQQKPAPRGVIGELYVGGAGVSRGYLGKEELTRTKFISHPYAAGERLYRSGDLAKILTNGDIEYIGRIDDQVKIRGFRIEPGEIENQLSGHTEIKESIVMAKEKAGDKYLVAYYVSGKEIEASELRSYMRGRVPDYMVPTYYVHLDKWPLTSNGKLDRKALPEPGIKTVEETSKPRNEVQKELVKIWAEILLTEEDKIGVHTNFFDIGGNSLKVVRLADKINNRFNVELSVSQVFAYPVISMLAEFLDREKEKEGAVVNYGMEANLDQMTETIDLFNQVQQ